MGLVGVAHAVRKLSVSSVAMIVSMCAFAVLLVAFAWSLLLVAGIGTTLILLRAGFLEAIPFMLDHIKVFTDIANTMILIIDAIQFAFYFIYDAVVALIKVVHAVECAFKPSSCSDGPGFKKDSPVKLITYAEFKRSMQNVAEECTGINSMSAIVSAAAPRVFGPWLCPLLRAGTPLAGVGRLSEALSPTVPDPTPWPGNNCDPEYTPLDNLVLCDCIGVGYFVLELLFPILVLGILLMSSGGAIAALVLASLEFGAVCTGTAASWLHWIVYELRQFVGFAFERAVGAA